MKKAATNAAAATVDDQLYDDFGNPITTDGDDAEDGGELYDDAGNPISVTSRPTTAVYDTHPDATGRWQPGDDPSARFDPVRFSKRAAKRMMMQDALSFGGNLLRNASVPVTWPYFAATGFSKEEHGEPTTTAEDLSLGPVKGAAATITGLGKLATDFAGLMRRTPPDPNEPPGPFADLDRLQRDLNLDPQGFTQGVGFLGEKLAEAFIPAGSVNRGIAMAGSGGRLAKLMAILGLEGAAGFGTSMAQTGGDTETSAKAGLVGAGARGVLSLPGLMRMRPGEAQELMELAAEFRIPLDKAEQTQRSISQLVKGLVKQSATGARILSKFELARNQKLAQRAATDLIDMTKAMDPKTAGEFIKTSLDDMDKMSRQEYATVVDDILSRTGKVKLEVAEGSELHKRAVELKDQWSLPFLEGAEDSVDDIKTAKSFFDKFIHVSKDVDTGLVDPSGKKIVRKVTKELDFEEAKKIRTVIFKITDSDNITIGKGSLRALNSALDTEIGRALDRAGHAQDAQLFRAAGARFRQTRELLEDKVIEQMAKNSTPETILDTLLRPGAETRAERLRAVLHKEGMEKVRAALWRRMLDPKSASSDDVLMGQRLKRMLDDMGPGAKQAIFGDPALIGKIQRFAELADRLRIPGNLPQRIEQGLVPMAGQFGARAIAGGVLGAGVRNVLGQDEEGNLKVWVVGGAVAAIAPAVAARMMTRPGVVDDMTKALAADPATTAGKALAAKIATYVAQATNEERAANPSVKDWLMNPDHPLRNDSRPKQGKTALQPMPVADPNHPDEFNNWQGRAENHALMTQLDPRRLLPEHFKNARKIRIGQEIKPGSSKMGTKFAGIYLPKGHESVDRVFHTKPFYSKEAGGWVNLPRGNEPHGIVIHGSLRGDNEKGKSYYPGVIGHELGHAIWFSDLTTEQKAEWDRFHKSEAGRIGKSNGPWWMEKIENALAGGEIDLEQVPDAIRYYKSDAWHSYAQAVGDFMSNPTQFRNKYPRAFTIIKKHFGRDYIKYTPEEERLLKERLPELAGEGNS